MNSRQTTFVSMPLPQGLSGRAGMPTGRGVPRHIRDFDPRALVSRRIATGGHCFGCTAGHGSSCGGALTTDFPDQLTAVV